MARIASRHRLSDLFRQPSIGEGWPVAGHHREELCELWQLANLENQFTAILVNKCFKNGEDFRVSFLKGEESCVCAKVR